MLYFSVVFVNFREIKIEVSFLNSPIVFHATLQPMQSQVYGVSLHVYLGIKGLFSYINMDLVEDQFIHSFIHTNPCR